MEICRPEGLGEIADLGLSLPEAKQLLTSVQRAVVASQADQHGRLRPYCRSCSGRCHVKDWRSHRIATLFGEVTVRLPRFLCAACNRSETGINWPLHCRSTPELHQLQAHLSALMTYRVAAGVLQHLLPVTAGKSPETLRSHTLRIGERARRQPWLRRSPSAWIQPSSAVAKTASGTSRSASEMSRLLVEAGRCSERWRKLAPTYRR